MLLSCICFGIGEALLLAAFAGTAGLGVHAATCKPQTDPDNGGPGVDPTAPTCCGHDHHPATQAHGADLGAAGALTPEGRPGALSDYAPNFKPKFLQREGAPGMSSALRTTTLVALIGFAVFMFATCAAGMFGNDHDHSHDHAGDTEPCGHGLDDRHVG